MNIKDYKPEEFFKIDYHNSKVVFSVPTLEVDLKDVISESSFRCLAPEALKDRVYEYIMDHYPPVSIQLERKA